jgi:hypothetical protein
MDVNFPYDDTHPSPLDNPPSSAAHYEHYEHTSHPLDRRATTPHPRRRHSSQSIHSFASSERVSLSNPNPNPQPSREHTDRVHHAHPSRPAPARAGTRILVPAAGRDPAVAGAIPQRKRVFTGPWYNRRGDMWVGVGSTPGDFRVVNSPEMTFHPNFQNFPSEHGHFMNADGDIMDAVSLRMIYRAPS